MKVKEAPASIRRRGDLQERPGVRATFYGPPVRALAVGIERIFPLHSPQAIGSIDVVGKVNAAPCVGYNYPCAIERPGCPHQLAGRDRERGCRADTVPGPKSNR